MIYDIFGYFPQTIQGADILAYSDKEHAYQVFMPDFFDGEPADIAWLFSPLGTEEEDEEENEREQRHTKIVPSMSDNGVMRVT